MCLAPKGDYWMPNKHLPEEHRGRGGPSTVIPYSLILTGGDLPILPSSQVLLPLTKALPLSSTSQKTCIFCNQPRNWLWWTQWGKEGQTGFFTGLPPSNAHCEHKAPGFMLQSLAWTPARQPRHPWP